MKTKRRLKGWVKVFIGVLIGLLVIIIGVKLHNNYEVKKEAYEKDLVNQYVECLNNNFTQRHYCATEIGNEYHYMDLLMEKYGYGYKQVGYDLYVIEVNND